jgi:hypothetical protein
MGLFDFLKKKEEQPGYDITNLSVLDLDQGFILDYDMKSWQVKEVGEYDWGDNNFSREYKLDSGDDVLYLNVENDGELELSMSKNIKMHKLGENIMDETIKNEKPPSKIEYLDKMYYLDEDCAGFYNDVTKGGDDWEELINWEYYDDEEENVISITQWGEREFDASVGKIIKEYEISNIIPASS